MTVKGKIYSQEVLEMQVLKDYVAVGRAALRLVAEALWVKVTAWLDPEFAESYIEQRQRELAAQVLRELADDPWEGFPLAGGAGGMEPGWARVVDGHEGGWVEPE